MPSFTLSTAGRLYSILPLSLVLNLVPQAWLAAAADPVWQGVGQFNPNQPVSILLINKTADPLEYGLTDPRPVVTEVQPGESVEIKSVLVPNCLAANTPMLTPVQYQVNVVQNRIHVEVFPVNDLSGDHCLDLHPSGTLYVY
jgi:hypothetical protein